MDAPDFIFSSHGGVTLQYPASEAAREWISEHIPEDAEYFGDAVAIEPRYAGDILDGAAGDGLAYALRIRIPVSECISFTPSKGNRWYGTCAARPCRPHSSTRWRFGRDNSVGIVMPDAGLI